MLRIESFHQRVQTFIVMSLIRVTRRVLDSGEKNDGSDLLLLLFIYLLTYLKCIGVLSICMSV